MELDPNEFKIEDLKEIGPKGRGAFGEVFLAEYHGKKYAVKKISKKEIAKSQNKDYLTDAVKKEIEIQKKLSEFENSVKLYLNIEDDYYYIFILEACDESLADLLKKKIKLTVEEILYIMKGLNKVFKYMIKIGLVHRDIKPENILIKYVGDSRTKYIPKVADYGVSRKLDEGLASTAVGTDVYKAPEVDEEDNYDNKCDLYSIGVMLYKCYFNSSPSRRNSLKPNNNDTKLKDCEDKILDDLIKKLLVKDPLKRISWEEYFNHPFFKKGENSNIILGKEHQIIKFHEYTIEKILCPNNYISIDECLKSKDDSEFILGILGKYLKQIGIKVLIEESESPRNYELREYHKNIFQMICNNYILKKKYLFNFDLGEKRSKELFYKKTERGNFTEKLKKIILKEYRLKEEEIYMTNQRENNKFTVIMLIKSNFSEEITKDKLINIFGEKDDDLKTLSKIDIEKIIPLIKLNKSMLNPKQNNKNKNKRKIGEKRGGEDYIPPLGWINYAINIQNCFNDIYEKDDKNDENDKNDKKNAWISNKNVKGQWCTGYCGLKGITQSMEQIYENEDDFRHPGNKIGIGVYCTSDPSIMEKETETIDANGKKYMVGFMLRIKPDKIRACAKNNKIWIVNGNDNEFRPYGILVKEL